MNEKISDLVKATKIVRSWQQSGLEVVFTNGCFDILHAGHVRYLNTSKAYGDRLVIGVNADASVSALKGPGRPFNTLADRMEILAALSCTDLIIPFEEETPLELISALIPDILTKGGDYTPDTVVGADIVTEHGGEVKIIDFEKGYSSTKTLEKVKDGG